MTSFASAAWIQRKSIRRFPWCCRTEARSSAGVEVDRLGRPIAFHIYRHWIPGLPLLTNLELTRVEATDVLHLFQVEGAGQTRGMSRLAAVLLRLRELDSLTDGQLVRLKIGAMLAGFIQDADGTLLAGENPGEVSLEPGTMTRLRPGESVSFQRSAADWNREQRFPKRR